MLSAAAIAFEGYGNVKVATNHGNRAGWQLICYECQKLSDVIHRAGSSYPPKVLVQTVLREGLEGRQQLRETMCALSAWRSAGRGPERSASSTPRAT